MMGVVTGLIVPDVKDLGGFQVRRLLPPEPGNPPTSQVAPGMVGPFIFFDHMGPAAFAPGKGLDVRPHPHINLATVTYLFEGSILHRDSLGSVQEIQPGAVNWMTAGRGIVHSERTPERDRPIESPLHGIQTWVALPADQEETDPGFWHHPASEIPTWETKGGTVRIIVGEAFGRVSPVKALSPILYLDLEFSAAGEVPLPTTVSERAIYAVTPGLALNGEPLPPHQLAILAPGEAVTVSANGVGRCVVVGGEPLGDRIKWWNLVSSRPERIEQAKQNWKAGRFPKVPDEPDFIPLPE